MSRIKRLYCQLKEKFFIKILEEKLYNTLQWFIDNIYTLISALIVIAIEAIVSYYFLFDSAGTNTAVFIGLLAVTGALYMNYFSDKQTEKRLLKQLNYESKKKL